VIRAVNQGPLKITGFYVIERYELPGGNEWEGYIGIHFSGGLAPYKFALEGGAPQSENRLYIRWRICSPAPVTLHVWSADGQEGHLRLVIPKWCR
jgi:hypothetical protein